ncbi:hypothetical protein C6A85_000000114110 [Mycobacterium sp. ITM-2017-0098]|nr:hypothetical protein C6A85_000000114110 [Mycobacterium sp. ITM-2017-0098]
MADLSHHTRELRRDAGFADVGVRDAMRTGLGFAVAALVFYVLASTWVGTCTGSIADAAGCAAPQRAMLTLGAPGILLVGGLWSLTRGVRARHDQTAWFGAGSALLALLALSVVVSLPSLPV